MSRRRIAVVCDGHSRLVPLGVLIPPARQPLTSEQYDAYVRQWTDYLHSTVHPEWTVDQCRTKALELARKNEVSQTEITYESSKGRLTNAGRWATTDRSGLTADVGRDGRVFTVRCELCKVTRRISASRLAQVIEVLDGDTLKLADL